MGERATGAAGLVSRFAGALLGNKYFDNRACTPGIHNTNASMAGSRTSLKRVVTPSSPETTFLSESTSVTVVTVGLGTRTI